MTEHGSRRTTFASSAPGARDSSACRGDAALVADSLVQADLWGHGSHGILRLPWYAARLRAGA